VGDIRSEPAPAAVVAALRALRAGDRPTAAALARAEAGDLAAALARHLARDPADAVYDEGTAFAAFIGNGTNPELYRRTIAALSAVHARRSPGTVLDIGCGDGRVTAAVIGAATARVDLVEPSADLLARARAALAAGPARVGAHHVDAARFLAGLPAGAGWDLAQSTFALHALPPAGRAGVLRGLAGRARTVAIAEFDVPALDGEAWTTHLAERYALGVHEYRDHPEVVDGFLMPVLVGQVEPGRARHTFEQPAAAWEDDLRAAGFTDVTTVPLHPYWWAPAVLITATS